MQLDMLYNLCINLKTLRRDVVVIHESKISKFVKKLSSRLLIFIILYDLQEIECTIQKFRVAS